MGKNYYKFKFQCFKFDNFLSLKFVVENKKKDNKLIQGKRG